jgi:hypothetical protein
LVGPTVLWSRQAGASILVRRGRPMKKPGARTRRNGTVRCAVYTRKSSEEGLEQEFNSLQAQREACEAFITSQRHEGWVCLPECYDDGGFSGATTARPALQQLLADLTAGRVDIVVVYKIDRPARSPILPRLSRPSTPGVRPSFRSRSSSTRRPRWAA